MTASSKGSSDSAARQQRDVQQGQDRKDEKKRAGDTSAASGQAGAVQAGAARQPENPMPAQHLRKPGSEAEMDLAPRFEARDYRGSGKLDGMVALVTGGDSGIGRAVAVLFAREGADVALAYLSEHTDAEATLACVEAEGRRGLLLPGDVRDTAYCREAVEKTVRDVRSTRHPGQ